MALTPADLTQITNLIAAQLANNRIKISQLPAAGTVTSDAVFPIVDSGSTQKFKLSQLLNKGFTVLPVGQDLRALDSSKLTDNQMFYIEGVISVGDGGEGFWRYDAGSVASDNIGTVIAPDDNAGRFLRQFPGGLKYSRWFGTVGDYVADDTAALQAAISSLGDSDGSRLMVEAGHYLTTGNLTARGLSNIEIFGAGMGATKIDSSATVDINTNPNGNGFCGTLAIGDDTGVLGVGGSLSTNIHLHDFTIKSSTSASVPVKNKGLLFQCAAKVIFERIEIEGGYREGIIGFGAEYSNNFIPYGIRVHNCRFADAPSHAVFQTFPGSSDVVLDSNHVENCQLGLFCFSTNAVVTNNTFKRISLSALYIGEGYDNNTGRTWGPTIVANNTLDETGYNGIPGGQVWAIRCTGSRNVYTGDDTEDIGLIFANNSILNSVCPSGGASFFAFSVIGNALLTSNYIAGCTGGAARIAFDIQKGITPSNPGTLGNTKVYLHNNVVDKTTFGSNDYAYGINVEGTDTIELYLTGNKIMRATTWALKLQVGASPDFFTAYANLNGELLNGPIDISGDWDSSLNEINPAGALDNIPLYGATDRTLSTIGLKDLFKWPVEETTPDTKGCRCNWYVYGDLVDPVTAFLNPVNYMEIDIVQYAGGITFEDSNGAVDATHNLLLLGGVDYVNPTQRSAWKLKYMDGNPVEGASAFYEISRSVNS